MIRLLRIVLICLCLLSGLGFLVLETVVLEDAPQLDAAAAPAPEDVMVARRFVRDVRAAAGDGETAGDALLVTETELNSLIRLGGRFIKGFRGHVEIAADVVRGHAALPVPWWSGRKWLNLSGEVPAFDGALRLSRVTLGGHNIPPGPALFLARSGANLILGERFGDRVLQSASAMRIEGDSLQFDLALDRVGQNGVMRNVFGSIRGQDMPTPDEIESYHLLIRAAMDDGTLPATGSFVTYLTFMLNAVLARSTAETLANEYTAAVFGLARACGALDFAILVGRLAFDTPQTPRPRTTNCDGITLNGRIDSRRHFITSAALQAASNRGVAVSLGEFKELYDTISGAGGFDFTDMAANLSGVRMSNVLMAAPRATWPDRLALLETESDIILSFEGIPGLMPEEVFKARYENVDSPAYRAMLAQIEARIDLLRFYRGL